jgi:hypothetical protein
MESSLGHCSLIACKLRKAHYLDCLQEHCIAIGIPETIKSNGDPTLLSAPVKQFLNQHFIHANRSELENQQQNHAEHGLAVVVLLSTHQMYPLAYKF